MRYEIIALTILAVSRGDSPTRPRVPDRPVQRSASLQRRALATRPADRDGQSAGVRCRRRGLQTLHADDLHGCAGAPSIGAGSSGVGAMPFAAIRSSVASPVAPGGDGLLSRRRSAARRGRQRGRRPQDPCDQRDAGSSGSSTGTSTSISIATSARALHARMAWPCSPRETVAPIAVTRASAGFTIGSQCVTTDCITQSEPSGCAA